MADAKDEKNKFSKDLAPSPVLNELIERALKAGQDDEESYLKKRARELAPKDEKNYMLARSIVLDVHFRLELTIEAAIVFLFCSKRKIRFTKKEFFDITDVIHKIECARRIKIVELIKFFNNTSIEILWKINDLRNAFAHRHPINDPKFLYYGESIFKRKTIDRLIADADKISDDFVAGLEREIGQNDGDVNIDGTKTDGAVLGKQ